MIDVKSAIKLLKQGKNVAIPTETVYGLAGIIDNPSAIENIFRIKERPFFDPLIIHVDGAEMAKEYCSNWNDAASAFADAFWPGPLTLVLPKDKKVNPMITSGLDSVGLRCPDHKLALEVISEIKIPLAAPSANKFKKTSPTSASAVIEEFSSKIEVLDGGPCQVGIESTVVGFNKNTIEVYRPGAITPSMLRECLSKNGLNYKVEEKESPVAPGQLKHHYMPTIPLFVCSQEQLNDVLLENNIDKKDIYQWTLPNDPIIASRVLYQDMRDAGQESYSAIWLDLTINNTSDENWMAILNRLEKAATFYDLD